MHKGLTSRPSRRSRHAHPPTDSPSDWCWGWPYAPWTKCSLVLSSSACCRTNTACSPRSRWQARKVPWCSGFGAKVLRCGHWGSDQRLPWERQNPSARSHPDVFAQSLVRSPSHWRRGSWKEKPKCSVHGSADWNSAADSRSSQQHCSLLGMKTKQQKTGEKWGFSNGFKTSCTHYCKNNNITDLKRKRNPICLNACQRSLTKGMDHIRPQWARTNPPPPKKRKNEKEIQVMTQITSIDNYVVSAAAMVFRLANNAISQPATSTTTISPVSRLDSLQDTSIGFCVCICLLHQSRFSC